MKDGSAQAPGAGDPQTTRRFRVPIATLLVIGFGTLMLVAVATVLYVGLYSAGRNTFALLTDKAELVQEMLEASIRHQFRPAELQAQYLLELFASGDLKVEDRQQIIDTLRGALAATPQVAGVGFVWPDGSSLRVGQFDGRVRVLEEAQLAEVDMRLAVEALERRREPYWGEPVYSQHLQTTLLTYRSPVVIDGTFRGGLFVAISLADLSRLLGSLSEGEDIEAVVLTDREYVIAHKNLTRLRPDFSTVEGRPPLLRIDEIEDPVIAQMWSDGDLDRAIERGYGFDELGITAEVVRIGNRGEYFQIKEILGYGPSLWMTVIHFPVREVGEEFLRLIAAAVFGVVVLIAAVAAALLIGRMIARRIRVVADAAQSLQDLDFENTPRIPDSRFTELALAARAFNTMVTGLRLFGTYVPRSLVLKLMRGGDTDAFGSHEREVTVMFTDIRGFSHMAQRMDATETADLLNRHFSLIGDCIEAEGGTVDKFIGDSVMAFWGAPEDQPDHAARALAAARSMVAVLDRENERRQERGLAPVGMRVAIHSGRVVVGNIGSTNRINYTIVGDAVNTAARIEELASALHAPDSAWIVLASEETTRSGGADGFEPAGRHRLRGLTGEIGLFAYDGRFRAGRMARTGAAGDG